MAPALLAALGACEQPEVPPAEAVSRVLARQELLLMLCNGLLVPGRHLSASLPSPAPWVNACGRPLDRRAVA